MAAGPPENRIIKMRIIRYEDKNRNIGYAAEQADGSIVKLAGDIYANPKPTTERGEVARLLAPIAPTNIICIGLNYRRHAEESGAKLPEYPVVFFKGINTVQHPGAAIELPTHLRSDEVDYECELAVVIGRPCKNVSRTEALNYVLGYT